MSSDPAHATPLADEGHERALAVVRSCVTEHGFLASPAERDNYRRIWARDGCIMGLAALLSGADDLVDAARQTLVTLARHQGPHGEIPSNVDPIANRVSYGGTTGRVDAGLWFTIACVELWRRTGDDAFLGAMVESLERLRALLGAWEFNARGLLYVPPTGDWADEYVQSGYVLYDQLLYLQAQRGMAAVHAGLHGGADHALDERVDRLTHLLRANYWFEEGQEEPPADVYHEVLYRKGRDAAEHCLGAYWLPFFSPLGYGTRFDGMANVLAARAPGAGPRDARCRPSGEPASSRRRTVVVLGVPPRPQPRARRHRADGLERGRGPDRRRLRRWRAAVRGGRRVDWRMISAAAPTRARGAA